MTGGRLREFVGAVAGHPVAFLLAINIVCAVLGLAQFGYAIAVLKPTDLAVIGVLSAIGSVVTGLVDVKLVDLTTKLYFAAPKDDRRRRAGVLTASLALHASLGLLIGAVVLAAGTMIAGRLLEQSPAQLWTVAIAARMAVAYPVNAMTSFLRLVGDFAGSGWLRLTNQIVVTVITLAALTLSPDLWGYFLAVAIGAVLSVLLAAAWVSHSIGQKLGFAIFVLPRQAEVAGFMAERRFMAGGSLTGWAKLLSRAGDTLLVAALASDTTTGLYRIARQAYDNLSGLTDAVHQFYSPTIVECVAQGRDDQLRKHRGRLMVIGAGAAAGALSASWLVLRPLAMAYYPHYLPALHAFEIMAALLVVTLGIHGWLWPVLVARGHVAHFGGFAIAGAVVQLAAIGGLALAGRLDATSAALTSWAMAAIGYGPALILYARPSRVRDPRSSEV